MDYDYRIRLLTNPLTNNLRPNQNQILARSFLFPLLRQSSPYDCHLLSLYISLPTLSAYPPTHTLAAIDIALIQKADRAMFNLSCRLPYVTENYTLFLLIT